MAPARRHTVGPSLAPTLGVTQTPAAVMRTASKTLLALAFFCAAMLTVGRSEQVVAEATAPVPLFDASTVAGNWDTKLVTVATLKAGERVQVTECRDRKSDIELLTVRDGMLVVIGGDSRSVKLHRREAFVWSHASTNSCRGFFESMSVASMENQASAAAQ
jgi:hypothetical protein